MGHPSSMTSWEIDGERAAAGMYAWVAKKAVRVGMVVVVVLSGVAILVEDLAD